MWVKFGFFLLHSQIHFFQRGGGSRKLYTLRQTPPPHVSWHSPTNLAEVSTNSQAWPK